MLIQLAIEACQCVVNRNVAGMSHGRFQSFHHHALVILMSCMTRWRLALLVFTHRTARQQPKNTARPSSRFIVFLLYRVSCIWSILQVFFFLCRVSCRFVAYSSCCAFRLERDSPAFSSFTLRHRNGCTTGACAGDLFYQCIDCCRQPQNASVWLQ